MTRQSNPIPQRQNNTTCPQHGTLLEKVDNIREALEKLQTANVNLTKAIQSKFPVVEVRISFLEKALYGALGGSAIAIITAVIAAMVSRSH